MQQLVVLFVGSFMHKKCLLLVDCVNCIYASAWVKCNEFEVILGRFFFMNCWLRYSFAVGSKVLTPVIPKTIIKYL